MEEVTKEFLSADIPLYKLNNKHIKNLFHDIGYVCHLKLLVEKQCCKPAIIADELQRIRNAVHDKQIFMVVHESTRSGINISIV